MLGLPREAPALDCPAPARWPAESIKGSHGSQSHRAAWIGPGSVRACTGPRGWEPGSLSSRRPCASVSRSLSLAGGRHGTNRPGLAEASGLGQWWGREPHTRRKNWPPLWRDKLAVAWAVLRGLCDGSCPPTDGPAESASPHPDSGPGGPSTMQPPPLAFWRLCIGTNKACLFSELHPVCVSAYPAPGAGGQGPGGVRRVAASGPPRPTCVTFPRTHVRRPPFAIVVFGLPRDKESSCPPGKLPSPAAEPVSSAGRKAPQPSPH